MRLEVAVEREAYLAGDEVRGTVTAREGGRVRSLAVTLELREHGGSYDALAWEARAPLTAEVELPAGWSAPFALVLPPDALPSVRSPNGALVWAVRATADVRGVDPSAEHPIDVRRTRAEG